MDKASSFMPLTLPKGLARSSFRFHVKEWNAPIALLMSNVEETLLFHSGVTAMKVPVWVAPGVLGRVIGASATMIVGFWAWTTAGTRHDPWPYDRQVVALLPFCVANAERDPDLTKLAKVKAEQSSYSRSQLVSDSGWATMPGMTRPDRGLASACSDKLTEDLD